MQAFKIVNNQKFMKKHKQVYFSLPLYLLFYEVCEMLTKLLTQPLFSLKYFILYSYLQTNLTSSAQLLQTTHRHSHNNQST